MHQLHGKVGDMGSFKLGKMTLGSLFKKPETVMYPLEKRDITQAIVAWWKSTWQSVFCAVFA